MFSRSVASATLFTLALIGLLAGCSAESPTAEVSGTVTVDGVLVEKGSIGFIPVDGKTQTAGDKIENGKYTAKVPVGAMKVQIRVPKVTGKKKVYETGDMYRDTFSESLPKKYNDQTELRFDVKAGQKNEKDWELTTK
jgi:hypothetical protein